MRHSLVDQLNRYLGEETGLLTNGKPEYCWQWAPDLSYYWRDKLANLFGDDARFWVMCKWTLPKESEAWWVANHGSRWPYPRNGYYLPYVLTALGLGSLPTWHLTQNYAWEIKYQRSTSEFQQCVNVENDIAEYHHDLDVQWRQRVQDDAPAFGNCKSVTKLPGDKPHVVFGGLYDSKGEVAVAAG